MTTPGLFVTGTDTGVGKTVVSAALIRALRSKGWRVGAIKPVATGATWVDGRLASEDVDRLAEALGPGAPLDRICPILLEEPLAPPVAARRAGRPLLDRDLLSAFDHALDWWRERSDVIVVEGVGGLLCPASESLTVADLVARSGFPILIVARRALGTLNHTLLTVEAAERRGLAIAGIVLNGSHPTVDPVVEATNAEELLRRLPERRPLSELPHGGDVDAWAIENVERLAPTPIPRGG